MSLSRFFIQGPPSNEQVVVAGIAFIGFAVDLLYRLISDRPEVVSIVAENAVSSSKPGG